jgi:2-hydroxy-3-keto-5-methylthiopentenyl-1-phosphate phosphatase
MSDTIRIGRKPNIVTKKRSEIYFEMFTTDLERITKIIAASNYPDKIDPHVIWRINKNAAHSDEHDFIRYFNKLDENDQTMMYLFENIVDVNSRRKINRILMKMIDPNKRCTEKELMDLSRWEGSNHGFYCTLKAVARGVF